MTPRLIELLLRFTRPKKRFRDPSNYELIQVLKKVQEKEARNAETRTHR